MYRESTRDLKGLAISHHTSHQERMGAAVFNFLSAIIVTVLGSLHTMLMVEALYPFTGMHPSDESDTLNLLLAPVRKHSLPQV